MLPIPFANWIPRAFRDGDDATRDAFCAKMDGVMTGLSDDTKTLLTLSDPARAPTVCIEPLAEMLAANILPSDSISQKREKVSIAVEGHKTRGTFLALKPIIDVFVGGDSYLWAGWDTSAVSYIRGGLPEEPGNYWASIGCDGVDNLLGMLIIGTGTEFEEPGNIYVDVGSSTLTSEQVATLVVLVEKDNACAYVILHLGYASGSGFVEYVTIGG